MSRQEIYNSNYLRARAAQVVLKSIEELKEVSLDDAKLLAAEALKDAERNGCDDLDYLDRLYIATL